MARRKTRSPVMRRAWKLVAASPLGKVIRKQPTTTTTIVGAMDGGRKVFPFDKPLERFKVLKHRDAYHGHHHYEREFSPGSTPLFRWDQKSSTPPRKKRMFSFLLCGGGSGMDQASFGDVSPEINGSDVDVSPEINGSDVDVSPEMVWGDEQEEEEEEASVDRRAEEFIQRFYQEMRSQN